MEHPENSEEYKGLTVNKGIEQPSIVNPYLKLRKKPRRRQSSVGAYVDGRPMPNSSSLRTRLASV